MPLRDSSDPSKRASEIVRVLQSYRFMFADEAGLQEGVALSLKATGHVFSREVSLTKRDRIDFLVGDIGVECKIDHSRAALLRQLFRYARTGKVAAIVVVVGKMRLSAMPDEIEGVPIVVANIVRAFA
jgi:hypothetical protein